MVGALEPAVLDRAIRPAAGGRRNERHEWERRAETAGGAGQAGGAVLAASYCSRPLRPHDSVPTVPHPLGVNEGHAAHRRFALRIEILLRLQPVFPAVFAATVLG